MVQRSSKPPAAHVCVKVWWAWRCTAQVSLQDRTCSPPVGREVGKQPPDVCSSSTCLNCKEMPCLTSTVLLRQRYTDLAPAPRLGTLGQMTLAPEPLPVELCGVSTIARLLSLPIPASPAASFHKWCLLETSYTSKLHVCYCRSQLATMHSSCIMHITGKRREGWQRMRWLDGITNSKLREIVKDREAWCVVAHEVTKSRTWLCDWTTTMHILKSLGTFYLVLP